MIRKSFVFLDGIGLKKEKKIWESKIFDWDDFLESKNIPGVSKFRKSFYDLKLKRAKKELYEFNSSYFNEILPSTETWRLYDFFKDDAVFLDIETSNYYGSITVIGLYDNYEVKQFVRGINFDKKRIKEELKDYKLIVTFNGSSFDIPVIKRYFNDIIPDVPHIDLRHVCRRINLTGGLKVIEKILGIKRAEEVENLMGEDAIYLWDRWQKTGDREFLNRLIAYNEEDVINLKPIMEYCYTELKKQHGF